MKRLKPKERRACELYAVEKAKEHGDEETPIFTSEDIGDNKYWVFLWDENTQSYYDYYFEKKGDNIEVLINKYIPTPIERDVI